MRRILTRPAQRGFSYAEILLSVALLAILLVPALQALSVGIADNPSGLAPRQLSLTSKLEEVLSNPFSKLYAETYQVGGNSTTSVSANFSDAAGATDRRVVVFYRFDAAANTLSANDTSLLFVSVYFEADGSAGGLNTLTGRWW